jgi:hypothetical protein
VIPLALMFAAAACARSSAPAGVPRSIPALKLAVLSAVGGRLAYCDPDQYPIPVGDPVESARARLEAIKKDRAAFVAILQQERLTPDQRFTDEQLIAISDDYKHMQAIRLEPAGDGFRFRVLAPKSGSQTGTEQVSGTISRSGEVKIERRAPGRAPTCPICLAAGVRIATPLGDVPVQDVTVGMPVWTTDLRGRRILGVVLQAGRAPAPVGHRVVRLTLADGRSVVASPGHPTGDGRKIGELAPGDRLDGSRVASAVLVAYPGGMIYDLLPSGPTGTYFADGVLLRSTLAIGRPLASSS